MRLDLKSGCDNSKWYSIAKQPDGISGTWVGNTTEVLKNIQVHMQKIVSRGKKRQGSPFQDNFNISTNFTQLKRCS